MAVPELPEKYLNLWKLAIVDGVLALCTLIFQSVSVGVWYYSTYGIGFWGALVIAITGGAVFQLSKKGGDGWLVGFALGMAGMSVLIGFILAGFTCSFFGVYYYCTGYYSCSAWMGMNVMLLLCGLATIAVNIVVGYALVKHFIPDLKVSPPSSAA